MRDYLTKEFLEKSLIQDIGEKNPDDLFNKYYEIAKRLHLHKHKLAQGEKFFRARKGYLEIPGGIDDCDVTFTYPYYGREISAPPPIRTAGSRFNRDGYSYLYLTSDKETCVAEIHLEVNQICSIAQFECVKDGDYLRLIPDPNYQDGYEMMLYEILTQPIHEEIKYKYHITQLFSDIIKQFGYRGIYFKSTQTNGHNIVCFHPEDFKYIDFSEQMFTATRIQYTLQEVQSNYKGFADYRRSINSYNSSVEELREEQLNHIQQRIALNDQEEFRQLKQAAENEICLTARIRKYNKLVAFAKNIPTLQMDAYILRGTYLMQSGQMEKAIEDLITGFSGYRKTDNYTIQKVVAHIKTGHLMPEATDMELKQRVEIVFGKMKKRQTKKNNKLRKNLPHN